MQSIAVVRQKYNPTGGAERFVSNALASLQKNGAQVCLISRQWQAIAGVSAVQVNPFYLGRVWRDYGFACAVRRLLRRQPFALVQTHERVAGCDIFRAGDGVHRVWLQHSKRALGTFAQLGRWLNPYHYYVCRAEKGVFHDPKLKAVICNSRMVQQEIHTLFHLPIAKLPVIYNGVDTAHFHPDCREAYRRVVRQQYGIAEDAPLLVYVGSGFYRKGVARAFNAIVPFPEVQLLIVGEDKHRKQYMRLAHKMGIGQRCHFTGAQQAVLPFYAAADAFILPTLYDPFPNAALEALACGLPVLTSLQCGTAELLEAGVNGWVCDALDELAWQRHIKQWLQRRAEWPLLRANARKLAESLNVTDMTQQLLALYQTVLAEAG